MVEQYKRIAVEQARKEIAVYDLAQFLRNNYVFPIGLNHSNLKLAQRENDNVKRLLDEGYVNPVLKKEAGTLLSSYCKAIVEKCHLAIEKVAKRPKTPEREVLIVQLSMGENYWKKSAFYWNMLKSEAETECKNAIESIHNELDEEHKDLVNNTLNIEGYCEGSKVQIAHAVDYIRRKRGANGELRTFLTSLQDEDLVDIISNYPSKALSSGIINAIAHACRNQSEEMIKHILELSKQVQIDTKIDQGNMTYESEGQEHALAICYTNGVRKLPSPDAETLFEKLRKLHIL